jgi:hypothetical protein
MSTTAPVNKAPKPRKVATAIAQRGPNLDALDQALSETVAQMKPMISRVSSRRAQLQSSLKQREAEGQMLKANWELVEAHYEAARQAYAAEAEDISDDIKMIRNALLDGAEQQERTAA